MKNSLRDFSSKFSVFSRRARVSGEHGRIGCDPESNRPDGTLRYFFGMLVPALKCRAIVIASRWEAFGNKYIYFELTGVHSNCEGRIASFEWMNLTPDNGK